MMWTKVLVTAAAITIVATNDESSQQLLRPILIKTVMAHVEKFFLQGTTVGSPVKWNCVPDIFHTDLKYFMLLSFDKVTDAKLTKYWTSLSNPSPKPPVGAAP